MSTVIQDKFATIKEHFSKLFEEHEQRLNGAKFHPLYDLRKNAIDQLPAIQFPTRRDEDWKYTPLTRVLSPEYTLGNIEKITAASIAPYTLKATNPYLLVFVNGNFNEELSDIADLPEGVSLHSISDALKSETFSAHVSAQLNNWVTDAGRSLVTLNTAFAQNGFFINVDRNVAVERPFHFLYLQKTDSTKPFIASPQLIINAADSSELTVLETYHDLDANEENTYWNNSTNRITVGKNAHVHHYKLQNQHKESFQTTNMEVTQERDSTFSAYTIDLGGRIVRNNLSIYLKDQNTNSNMYGIYLGKHSQHIDNQSFMDHAFPHCESNELYKGILDDKAVGVFNGKVMVRQDAQKTNAFQQNSSLVLSETAKMDSKPQLEIFADDVKCSHGATIGQLEEDSIYYLRSRGLNPEQARSILQFAFLAEVLEELNIEAFKTMAEELVSAKLNK